MKFSCVALLLVWWCSVASYAQPRYSPEIRSKQEMQWLQDSVHISPGQWAKLSDISVTYQRQMDKAADEKDKVKKQARLMQKKDAAMRAILNKEQYRKYYKRESAIRKKDAVVYKGRQPM